MKICGRKMTTAPIPPMIPSMSRLRKGPSGKNASIVADNQAIAASIASMGSLAQENTALNMSNITSARTSVPQTSVREHGVEAVSPGDDRLDRSRQDAVDHPGNPIVPRFCLDGGNSAAGLGQPPARGVKLFAQGRDVAMTRQALLNVTSHVQQQALDQITRQSVDSRPVCLAATGCQNGLKTVDLLAEACWKRALRNSHLPLRRLRQGFLERFHADPAVGLNGNHGNAEPMAEECLNRSTARAPGPHRPWRARSPSAVRARGSG